MFRHSPHRPLKMGWFGILFATLCILAIILTGLLLPRSAQADAAQYQAAYTDSLLSATFASVPRAGNASLICADGAFGTNQAWEINPNWQTGDGQKQYIELQRYGAFWAESYVDGATLGAGDPQALANAKAVLDWAFAQQAPDGSFPATADPYHSPVYFLEAATRAVLLLKGAGLARDLVAAYAPRCAAGVAYLSQPDVLAHCIAFDAGKTHRLYMLAAMFLQEGTLEGNVGLYAPQYTLCINAALAAQLPAKWRAALMPDNADGSHNAAVLVAPDAKPPVGQLGCVAACGVNPENGGFDVSYQALGLWYAEECWLCLPDGTLRKQVQGAIYRGLRWEHWRINPLTGDVIVSGSSRIGLEADRTNGGTKAADYKALVHAEELGAEVTGVPTFCTDAQAFNKVMRWQKPALTFTLTPVAGVALQATL